MSNENNVMKAFEDAIAGSQLRKFDFGSYEISDVEKQQVEEYEAKILNTFRKYKNNLFDICSSLAEIEKILKPSGSFMAWYESAGLTKDMVSVFLKRWNLYSYFPDYKDKIFSLSDQAIKVLSHNSLGFDDVQAVLSTDVLKVKEIRELLAPPKAEEKVEVKVKEQKYFNFNKIKKMEKRVKKLKDEEKEKYKKELTEYINSLQKLMEEL
ncbi:hypothetical protein [Fusobacterium nucleatum]|jgi:hypothetical protein|uniref:hypothetical protein n=1 Tax=Fusobacterium nucleatum TaxID=851 RepID=UPI00201A5188|nr:hypothetical protein [Fusobacterium nucleatum]MCL4591721.1 hypothetical protein [Fusobacterium nucleatum YWH7053]